MNRWEVEQQAINEYREKFPKPTIERFVEPDFTAKVVKADSARVWVEASTSGQYTMESNARLVVGSHDEILTLSLKRSALQTLVNEATDLLEWLRMDDAERDAYRAKYESHALEVERWNTEMNAAKAAAIAAWEATQKKDEVEEEEVDDDDDLDDDDEDEYEDDED